MNLKVTKNNATPLVAIGLIAVFVIGSLAVFGLYIYHDLSDESLSGMNRETLIERNIEPAIVIALISTVPTYLFYHFVLKPRIDAYEPD